MDAAENAARIRDGYAAFNKGDVEALVELFTDDIVWHFPGTSSLAGTHVGRDAVLAALGGYGAASDGTLQANLVDVMANEDYVTGWARDTATAKGRTLDINAVVIFTMRDGRVAEARHFVDDAVALDAFLA